MSNLFASTGWINYVKCARLSLSSDHNITPTETFFTSPKFSWNGVIQYTIREMTDDGQYFCLTS